MNILKQVSSQRFVFLDIVKTIAIYMVCFYHFNYTDLDFISSPNYLTYLNYFLSGFASAGVPLFFMVNGALLLNSKFDLKRHIKRIVILVVLVILWGIITLISLALIFKDSYNSKEFFFALWDWKQGRINHLWFLQAIVCLYIFFPIIKISYDHNKKIIYFFLAVAFLLTFGNTFLNNTIVILEWLLNYNFFPFHNNFNFFNAFNAFTLFSNYSLVYFILGGLLISALMEGRLKIIPFFYLGLIILGLVGLFIFGIAASSNKTIFDSVYYGYDTIMTLGITISLFVLASKININGFLSSFISIIGSNTLGIYFLHIIVGNVLYSYLDFLPIKQSIVINSITVGIIMIVSLLLVLGLKKIPLVNLLFKI